MEEAITPTVLPGAGSSEPEPGWSAVDPVSCLLGNVHHPASGTYLPIRAAIGRYVPDAMRKYSVPNSLFPFFTMKLLVLVPVRVVVVLSMFVSCQDYKRQQTAAYEEKLNNPPPYRVVVVEGCQYLRFETTHGYGMLTHKGNCPNPIHCYRDTHTRGSLPVASTGP